MTDGGLTISKATTGVFLIEDLRVWVTHKDPTFIPANQVLASVDLHRALGSKILVQLNNSLPLQTPRSMSEQRILTLEHENKLLQEALAKSAKQGSDLQASMTGMEQRLASLVGAVEKLASNPQQVVQVLASGATTTPPSEAVGGDVPMFIPDNIVPSGAEVQVQVQEKVSEGTEVSDAVNRLRKLRKGQTS